MSVTYFGIWVFFLNKGHSSHSSVNNTQNQPNLLVCPLLDFRFCGKVASAQVPGNFPGNRLLHRCTFCIGWMQFLGLTWKPNTLKPFFLCGGEGGWNRSMNNTFLRASFLVPVFSMIFAMHSFKNINNPVPFPGSLTTDEFSKLFCESIFQVQSSRPTSTELVQSFFPIQSTTTTTIAIFFWGPFFLLHHTHRVSTGPILKNSVAARKTYPVKLDPWL